MWRERRASPVPPCHLPADRFPSERVTCPVTEIILAAVRRPGQKGAVLHPGKQESKQMRRAPRGGGGGRCRRAGVKQLAGGVSRSA